MPIIDEPGLISNRTESRLDILTNLVYALGVRVVQEKEPGFCYDRICLIREGSGIFEKRQKRRDELDNGLSLGLSARVENQRYYIVAF